MNRRLNSLLPPLLVLALSCAGFAEAQEAALIQSSAEHKPGARSREEYSPSLPNLITKAGNALVEPDGTLSWKALGRIGLTRHENTDRRYGPHVAYFAEPVVSAEIKALVGQRVKIRGYALPRGTADGAARFLISGRPAADPDGCAAGGAETFVLVRAGGMAAPQVDKLMVVEGTLTLFDLENWSGFIYQLTDVRIVLEGAGA